MLLLSHFSNLAASSSKKSDLDTPHNKKPRRLASVLILLVHLDFISILKITLVEFRPLHDRDVYRQAQLLHAHEVFAL